MFVRVMACLGLVLFIFILFVFGEAISTFAAFCAHYARLLLLKVKAFGLVGLKGYLINSLSRFVQTNTIWKWATNIFYLLIGIRIRKQIQGFSQLVKKYFLQRKNAMVGYYVSLSLVYRVSGFIIVITVLVVLSWFSVWGWIGFLFVSTPGWLIGFMALLKRQVFNILNKKAFGVAAMTMIRIFWSRLKKVIPKSLLLRARRLNYRAARRLVRQRRLTIRQLQERHKHHQLWFIVLRERWFPTKQSSENGQSKNT